VRASKRVLRAALVLCIGLFTSASVLALGPVVTPAGATGLPTYYTTETSGYAVYSATTPPAHVSAQFKVPTVSGCTATDRQIAAGAEVQDSGGAGASVFLKLGCHAGKTIYQGEFNVFGTLAVVTGSIKPNNLISVSGSMSATATKVTFTDKTTGVTKSVSGKGDVAAYASVTAGPIHEPPVTGVLLGVPKFTTLTFTSVQVNGANLGTYTSATGLYEFIRTTNGSAPPSGTIQILPGAVGTASFSLVWKHN
jgi:hypothetical protein